MTALSQNISLQFDGTAFKVQGWNPSAAPAGGWTSVFTIYAGLGDVPPLLGSYAVENGSLIFLPQFPITAGVKYRAVFHPSGVPKIERTFDGPPRDMTPIARVERVYPSDDVIPSNELRLYVYFSTPMSRGEAARYIHILDGKGKPLQGRQALFLPGQELWDPQFQRLTMTFDPGRIKRGLTSNATIGPPIEEGKSYTLVIDREWPDARGVAMVEVFRKDFRGGPAQRTPPDPQHWQIQTPAGGSTGPLVVEFPTAMNYPLLQRMIQVLSVTGSMNGTISVEKHETEWRFTPRQSWKPGVYQLVVDSALEDLAGNKIGQPFDIDTFDRVTEHIATKTVKVPFRIR